MHAAFLVKTEDTLHILGKSLNSIQRHILYARKTLYKYIV